MAVFYVLKLLPNKEGINIQTAFWVKFFFNSVCKYTTKIELTNILFTLLTCQQIKRFVNLNISLALMC